MYKLGLVLTIIGVIVWPLLLIGIPLLIVGRNEERKEEKMRATMAPDHQEPIKSI